MLIPPIGSITSMLLTPPITVAEEIAAVVVNVSVPAPPSIISVLPRLAAAVIISLPAPPSTLSAPVPRLIVSLPAPASITFEPAVAVIISLPAPASNVSALVPRVKISAPGPAVTSIGVAVLPPVNVNASVAVRPAALIVKTPVPDANEYAPVLIAGVADNVYEITLIVSNTSLLVSNVVVASVALRIFRVSFVPKLPVIFVSPVKSPLFADTVRSIFALLLIVSPVSPLILTVVAFV